MEIIYNPPNGSKIEDFIVQNVGKIAPHEVGEIKQYDPGVAELLLATFGFLEKFTSNDCLAPEAMEPARRIPLVIKARASMTMLGG